MCMYVKDEMRQLLFSSCKVVGALAAMTQTHSLLKEARSVLIDTRHMYWNSCGERVVFTYTSPTKCPVHG